MCNVALNVIIRVKKRLTADDRNSFKLFIRQKIIEFVCFMGAQNYPPIHILVICHNLKNASAHTLGASKEEKALVEVTALRGDTLRHVNSRRSPLLPLSDSTGIVTGIN